MGAPSRRDAFVRGLQSIERRGSATIYKVVFGEPRPKPTVAPLPIRFEGVEPEPKPDGEGRLGWLLAVAFHILLAGLALYVGIPQSAHDPVAEQGVMVEFLSEDGAAATGKKPEELPAAALEPASIGKDDRAGMALLATPSEAGIGQVAVGAEQDAGGGAASPPPNPAAIPTPPAARLPTAPAKSAGSVSPAEAEWEGAIVARIDKKKRYPKMAAALRLEDKVMLRIAIDREGRLIRSEIARSKGHAVLNAEAMELARRSSPYPAPPASVVGEEVSLVVPVEFKVNGRK